jgi:formamidopyrimidine-DNA glycosylase
MPELPEVETVRRGLVELVQGYTIRSAQDFHARALKPTSLAPLHNLVGAKISAVNRRGKFLWFTLNRDEVLVAHLGMSGQFLLAHPDRPAAKHVRARFNLSRGLRSRELMFVDQRTFGWLSIEPLVNGIAAPATHIALDPFDPNFDKQAVITRIRSRKAAIKSIILNQEIMSGVGNIYADESLWRAKIHPETPSNQLSARKVTSLVDYAAEVMSEALALGGTSFDAMYINVNGESGFFDQSLAAYGQTGKPCPRCGRPIKRIAFGNRSSHFCPRCQTK